MKDAIREIISNNWRYFKDPITITEIGQQLASASRLTVDLGEVRVVLDQLKSDGVISEVKPGAFVPLCAKTTSGGIVMKSLLCAALCFSSLLIATAATVSDVTARQRYPWNGMVDIDYTITGADTEDTAIAVKVTDTDTGKVYTPTNFLEVPPTVAGRHRITWSTEADRLNLIASNVTVTVSLLKYAAAAITNDLFYVIDLSGGPNATRWPVSCLATVPKGGWTDEYKTTKLVLRRIEKGSISEINSGFWDAVSSITIDKPYYIGVFEVTSAQYARMRGGSGDARPQKRISYDMLRGTSAGALYPDSTAVDATSVIGILRAKTGLTTLDLPTEAQWEYACRAGTTSDYNNGGSTEADLATLGRYSGNKNDGRGGFSGGTTTVGSYAPNRWGLYDMHGNVYEWCLEWYSQGQDRALRGGDYSNGAGNCRSGRRFSHLPSYVLDFGFRLCCSAGL